MDGVIVIEALEFAPTFWWVLLKVVCVGVCALGAIAFFVLAIVLWDANSEFLFHEIVVEIGIFLAMLAMFASAMWISVAPYPVEDSYPREVVSVSEDVDINKFCELYDIIDYNDDGTFVVQKKD